MLHIIHNIIIVIIVSISANINILHTHSASWQIRNHTALLVPVLSTEYFRVLCHDANNPACGNMPLLAMSDTRSVWSNVRDSPADVVPTHATQSAHKIQIPNANVVCGEILQAMKPNLDVSDSKKGHTTLDGKTVSTGAVTSI